MRLIGTAFMLLAVYIAAQSVYVVVRGEQPAVSLVGIAWTAVTCVAMLALAYGKTRVGAALDNPVLRTEGRHVGGCLSRRHSPGWPGAECATRLVVGRPARWLAWSSWCMG